MGNYFTLISVIFWDILRKSTELKEKGHPLFLQKSLEKFWEGKEDQRN
jgi:hypothetical protein